MAKIISCVTERPEYQYDTPEIIEAADKYWLHGVDPKVRRMALKILTAAEIDRRGSVVPIETVFSDLSFEEKNDIYIREAIGIGEKVLAKGLADAKLGPTDIDVIITTSCTGFMIPSVDAYLVNRLGMRQNIIRLPVTEMGCAGGTSALIYADNFLRANPDFKVAIVSVEIPSITFQKQDFSMENLVSTAIFADGASCVILGNTDKVAPVIQDTSMYHFPDTDQLMGYQLKNSGLKIVLDREVPTTIDSHFKNIFFPFLDKNNLSPSEIHNYLFHPGGKKIINKVEDFITKFGKDISDSKEVLKKHGNMSSSTILHILERFMRRDIKKDELGYMLAFGPGFMAQSILLKWE